MWSRKGTTHRWNAAIVARLQGSGLVAGPQRYFAFQTQEAVVGLSVVVESDRGVLGSRCPYDSEGVGALLARDQ